MRSILVLAVGGALAIASGLSAFSQVGQRIAPQQAAVAFPNGLAKANLASALYVLEMREAEDPTASPSDEVTALAFEALSLEPLADDAMFVAARSVPAESDERLAALETAIGLTRRSNRLSLDLLGLYAVRNRNDDGLKVLDAILRRETVMHGPLLETLAQSGGRTDLHDDILALLRDDPPWASQFWRQLAQSPGGLAGAADLWKRHRKAGGTVEPELEKMLVAGLAGTGRYDEAAEVAATITGRPLRPGTLFASDFSDTLGVPPLSWVLTSTGDYGAEISPKEGKLFISALAGSRGVAASQVARLAQGTYRIDVSAEPTDETRKTEDLVLRIDCLDPKSRGRLLEKALGSLPTTFAAGNCRWAQIALVVAVPSDADARDWTIDSIALSRAGDRRGG